MAAPPTKPALRARYDRRRAEVIDVAAKVFAERGYHATSIEDLVRATRMTKGGLYHYTAGKEDLLLGVVEELMDPLLTTAKEALKAEGTAESRLRALLTLWLEHVANHRDHMIVFGQERRTLERTARWRQLRLARRSFERLLTEAIDAGCEDGSFAVADRRLALMMLLGAVNHVPQWFRPNGRLKPADIAELYCDLLLDGIRSA